MKIKDAELLKQITGNEKIPVSNGSDAPATITVNQILEKKTKTSTNILEITYDELKNLKDNSQLVPEQKYRMIDYETIVQGDDALARRKKILIKRIPVRNRYRNIKILQNKFDLCSMNIAYNNDRCLKNIKFSQLIKDLL